MAPKNWVFSGADFNSLEDYISALTTKDPNKLDVYLKQFDGHCLRAAYYYRDQLPHINLSDPKSVNSLKKTHPELRQSSKPITFLLTYGGSYIGLMRNCGLGEQEAKQIEANYHKLYAVSDKWVEDKINQATRDGYVTVAFGLRVRTPLLSKSVLNNSKTLHQAEAEGRTAANALGQSYGLLNNRAAIDFMKRVWASPYRLSVLPVSLIHDAIYLLIEDSIEVVAWVNKNLIDAMKWQELPELHHDLVKLGAELSIFYPTWANEITLPNDADAAGILKLTGGLANA
jgi:DNA polymerase-1